MESETRDVLRWTVGSAAIWGGLFLTAAAVRAGSVGVSLTDAAAPLLAFGVIGATVGGLTGPMVRLLWRRIRGGGA